MDRRNIKSKGYDSGEEEEHDSGAQMGKNGQKGDFVSKVVSRSRFIIIAREVAMDGSVTYTLQRVEPAEDDSGRIIPDSLLPTGKSFKIRDIDENYYLSPFRFHGGRIEPIVSDDEEMFGEAPSSRGKKVKSIGSDDEEMSDETPSSRGKKEKSKGSDEMEISTPMSAPVPSIPAPAVLALVIDGNAQALSNSEDDALIWACHWASTLPLLATLRTAVMRQRRAADIDEWIKLQKGSGKKDFLDVAILITLDKNTSYSYEKHIIYIKNAKNRYDLLHQIIFELCNATHRTDWQRLDAAAHAGIIGCVAYVYAKEALELLTEQEHDQVLTSILSRGEEIIKQRERDARQKWPIKTPSELSACLYNPDGATSLMRLRVQIKSGHTEGYVGQWAADFLVLYMRKNPTAKIAYQQWLNKTGKAVDETGEITALGIPGLATNISELKLVITEVAKWSDFLLDCIKKMK